MFKALQIFIIIVLHLCLYGAAGAYGVQKRPDEGQNMRFKWKSGVIQVSLSNSLTTQNPNIRPDSDVTGAIRRSFAAWGAAGNIEFEQTWSDKQTVSPAGNAGDGVSLITIAQTPENLLLFSKDSGDVSARTRVFFNGKGFITEADIVLNPYQQFSTDGAIGTFDLESTITHEIGHLLGLEHSAVFGATMHDNYGKNGVFSLQSFSARTLSADDIASLRALYGAKAADADDCCGRIAGKLSAKVTRNFQVWAEDAETGRVVSETAASPDGTFRMEGVLAGTYEIFAQGIKGTTKNSVSTESLGRVTVEKGKVANVGRKLTDRAHTFELSYAGFNGQLSELAVTLNRGKAYTVYLGGRRLDSENMQIGLSSPFLGVSPGTISSYEYGDGLSVISFEIIVKPGAPLGEYSVFLENGSGERRTIIGALTVEEFPNPWNTSIVPED
jgi:Matrixin